MTKCAHVLSLMWHTFELKILLKRTTRGNVQRQQMNSVKYACIFRGKFNLCPSLQRMMFLGRFKRYYHIKDTFNGNPNGICHCFEVHTKAQFDRSASLNFLTKGDNKQLLIHFLFIYICFEQCAVILLLFRLSLVPVAHYTSRAPVAIRPLK